MKPIDMPERNELRAGIEYMRRHIGDIIEHAKIQAKVKKATYDALVAEGFTEAQALQLCTGIY